MEVFDLGEGSTSHSQFCIANTTFLFHLNGYIDQMKQPYLNIPNGLFENDQPLTSIKGDRSKKVLRFKPEILIFFIISLFYLASSFVFLAPPTRTLVNLPV